MDPTTKTGAAAAKDNEDLLIAAKEGWLLVFDNINQITREMADNLCRLATGAAMGRRTKYSDADETIFVAKNPVVITAIADVITQADLLDRALRFVLSKLKRTKDEKVLEKRFRRIAAYILGYILDGVSAALSRNLPTTAIADPPRMIGFALWGTAAEEGLGLKSGAVMEAYRRNIGLIHQMILESDLARRSLPPWRRRTLPGSRRKRRSWLSSWVCRQPTKAANSLLGNFANSCPLWKPEESTSIPTGSSTGCATLSLKGSENERNITTHSRKECHDLSRKKLPPRRRDGAAAAQRTHGQRPRKRCRPDPRNRHVPIFDREKRRESSALRCAPVNLREALCRPSVGDGTCGKDAAERDGHADLLGRGQAGGGGVLRLVRADERLDRAADRIDIAFAELAAPQMQPQPLQIADERGKQ